MAMWMCTGCTTAYAVGVARCPQCGSTEYVEEGAEGMAKITVHGGPSDAIADSEGSESSPGTSSSTSSGKGRTSRGKSGSAGRSPARTTGSPSVPDRTETSTARQTDGDRTGAESETSSTVSDT